MIFLLSLLIKRDAVIPPYTPARGPDQYETERVEEYT
jgi:hypothetical protein